MTTPNTCGLDQRCPNLPRCALCTQAPNYWRDQPPAATATEQPPPTPPTPTRPAAGITLDWSGRGGAPPARIGDPAPCQHCGRDALLRHPVNGKPCHKACEEAAIDQRAEETGGAA